MSLCVNCRPIKVLKSAAGYYIGTTDDEGMPNCRLSIDYYNTEKEAQEALDSRSYMERTGLENDFCKGKHPSCIPQPTKLNLAADILLFMVRKAEQN